VVIDPGQGLAAAINAGAKALPNEIEYLNWLGDDDVLMGDGHRQLVKALRQNPKTVLAYGYCSYLNMAGDTIFQVRPGRWAEKLLRFGPQLISQPAVLFRRDAFERVGGLDESLRWAFDLELFIKLSRVGQFVGVSLPAAGYRWHTAALTVGQRSGSVREASLVRRRNLSPLFRWLAWVWEPFVRWSILFAGGVVSRRAVTQRAHDS
jgi:GT2 family glycosyltransferase